MRKVNPLTEAERVTLQEMHKQHPLPWSRHRAHAVLLSAEGYRVKEIAGIYGVCRQTASNWLTYWETLGLRGLIDQARSGRPKKLSIQEQQQALEWLTEEPRSIRGVQAELKKRFGKEVSRATLKRLCKKAGLVWKRMRKSLKGWRNPEAFADSVERLARLMEREARGEIELYYFDESGFTLVPCVPYAWQPKGETLELPSSRSRSLNVLGFMNRSCEVQMAVFEGAIDARVVVHCFDQFMKYRRKEVVVVMDNSPLHTSEEFEDQLERWAARGLTIEFIAPYSPELNLIEILWRKVKYEWLPLSSYGSFEALKENLFHVLGNIGKEYKIAFS